MYTPYYPGGWKDQPDHSTPVIAAALDNMEAGIEAAQGNAPWQFPVGPPSGGDDTPAIKTAIAAAIAYAAASDFFAEVLFEAGTYLANSAPTIGGSFKGNAIIPLLPQPVTAGKVVLKLTGAPPAAADALPHWQQLVPQLGGTTIATTRTDGTDDGTYGPAFVIGGPWDGYGGEPGLFSNMCIVVDGLTIQTPFNGTYGGFGFFGIAQARVLSAAYMPAAIVPSGGAFPQFDAASITNQWTYGLQMPCIGNNDLSDVLFFSAYGATYGFMPSEHCTAESIRANYCVIGIEGYSGTGGAMVHGARIKYASVEDCAQGLGFLDGTVKLDIDTLDAEAVANVIFDPSNHGQGSIGIRSDSGAGYHASGFVDGGTGLAVTCLDNTPGPVGSPQAAPASTVAWGNFYYRDAEITLSVAGGSLSALEIDATAQVVPAAATFYRFTLPAGHSYTPTYTGALTHTVTLL